MKVRLFFDQLLRFICEDDEERKSTDVINADITTMKHSSSAQHLPGPDGKHVTGWRSSN